MKKTEKNPEVKFKQLLKGSALARNLSLIYVLLSLILAYKMRTQIEYVVPLLLGAALIIWYTVTYLSLNRITLIKNDLRSQFDLYKISILKREKYEAIILFIWALTIIPAYLSNQEITISTLIGWLIIIFIVFVLGNGMFKIVKKELKELEQQMNSIEINKADSFDR